MRFPTVCGSPERAMVSQSPCALWATTAKDGPEATQEGYLRPLSSAAPELSVGRAWVELALNEPGDQRGGGKELRIRNLRCYSVFVNTYSPTGPRTGFCPAPFAYGTFGFQTKNGLDLSSSPSVTARIHRVGIKRDQVDISTIQDR